MSEVVATTDLSKINSNQTEWGKKMRPFSKNWRDDLWEPRRGPAGDYVANLAETGPTTGSSALPWLQSIHKTSPLGGARNPERGEEFLYDIMETLMDKGLYFTWGHPVATRLYYSPLPRVARVELTIQDDPGADDPFTEELQWKWQLEMESVDTQLGGRAVDVIHYESTGFHTSHVLDSTHFNDFAFETSIRVPYQGRWIPVQSPEALCAGLLLRDAPEAMKVTLTMYQFGLVDIDIVRYWVERTYGPMDARVRKLYATAPSGRNVDAWATQAS